MKVMIVDDHDGVRQMIKSYLSDLVDEFFECANGEGAVDMFRANRPDLVLMDIRMKDVDGIAATKLIRDDFPDANVVIVSHWETRRLRDLAAVAGASGYVNKGDLFPLRMIVRAAGA